ncbi:hypothetical protein CHLRE_12g521600v5 [Chlamydomonas reinhardtii]|uniref:Endonuclease/exonuclease/phosphatase domain-containing protein n=1 Tax=Chlamydomonas reinhardtii TaxID=3055 RepID=A0A2K3D449_CHLRE|nr:uncharacterized protein CHLRE_12g521600v5 [Chlamydomonas reinhardtii]PNW75306.1 hypothetical protein CHLRE_12g521600v5 [Chlamydomonas reinhardtii]
MASFTGPSFSVLTYNINDNCVSDRHPSDWSMRKQHEQLARLILQHQPDLLCLQECFSGIPANDTLKGAYEFCALAVPSHRGDCMIARRRDSPLELLPQPPPAAVGPCLLLRLRLGGQELTAACAHLAPFAENAPKRMQQIARIVAAAPSELPLLLAGDMNMREKETPAAGEVGLMDAWVEAGSPPGQRWTWDTRTNKYYDGGHEYTARYDRILYRGCHVGGLRVTGNTPASDDPHHFLSDHFALLATVTLPAPQPQQ